MVPFIYLSLICGGPTTGGTVLSVRDAKVSITPCLGSARRMGTQAIEGAVWKQGDKHTQLCGEGSVGAARGRQVHPLLTATQSGLPGGSCIQAES